MNITQIRNNVHEYQNVFGRYPNKFTILAAEFIKLKSDPETLAYFKCRYNYFQDTENISDDQAVEMIRAVTGIDNIEILYPIAKDSFY